MGVRATVGGNLIGDAALCAAYANAKVPTFPPVSSAEIPTYKEWKQPMNLPRGIKVFPRIQDCSISKMNPQLAIGIH